MTEVDGADGADQLEPDPAFERLLAYLKESRSFDFTGYKRPSLTRRVRHQMQTVGVVDFDEYVDYLQVHPEEFSALFDTILINVTSFFRDEDAWDHLRTTVLPEVIEAAGDEPIRVWSAGCATGQEAYSLAIELTEALGPAAFRERVKIYATDVDDDALAVARHATYTDREVRGLPEGYLDRYFEVTGSRYAFRKDLRRNVIFGRADLVQDAPISRINLLACRNTLMYFNFETQAKIITRLGFALRADGVLLLGKAEMLLNHTATFTPIDLKRRLFRKLTRAETRDAPVPTPFGPGSGNNFGDAMTALRTEAFLTSPVAQLVVDADGRLALMNHKAAVMFALSDRDLARPFHDLEVSYRPAELRSHLTTVRDSRGGTRLHDVEWYRSATERLTLDIQVTPLLDARSRLLGTSIVFDDVSRFKQLQDELLAANRQLETAYEELQSTNEELETTNEELQSTVEELETTNEELQSTNEELETMNEELRSMNDELQTANENLRDRTDEITALNTFMESVLGGLDAGVIVVDADLTVQVWNRGAEELWGLRDSETIGQHVLALDSGLPAGALRPVLRDVVAGGRDTDELTLPVVNRRGRQVTLRVIVNALRGSEPEPRGALLMMTPSDDPGDAARDGA